MTHDPMCSFQVPTSYCKECDLIAKVREDERKKVFLHGAKMNMGEMIDLLYQDGYAAALRDAVEAVKARCEYLMISTTSEQDILDAIEALGGER